MDSFLSFALSLFVSLGKLQQLNCNMHRPTNLYQKQFHHHNSLVLFPYHSNLIAIHNERPNVCESSCVCVNVCVLVRSFLLLSFTTYLKYTWNINAEIKLSFPLRLGNSFVFCLSGFFLSLSDTHFSLSLHVGSGNNVCIARYLLHFSIYIKLFHVFSWKLRLTTVTASIQLTIIYINFFSLSLLSIR